MYLLIIVILLFLAELFYFRIADRCNIIDNPNERSSHTKVTLRGGGIIFYFGAFAYFLTSGFEYPWFLRLPALTRRVVMNWWPDTGGTEPVSWQKRRPCRSLFGI